MSVANHWLKSLARHAFASLLASRTLAWPLGKVCPGLSPVLPAKPLPGVAVSGYGEALYYDCKHEVGEFEYLWRQCRQYEVPEVLAAGREVVLWVGQTGLFKVGKAPRFASVGWGSPCLCRLE